jgi:hypothetical protein
VGVSKGGPKTAPAESGNAPADAAADEAPAEEPGAQVDKEA